MHLTEHVNNLINSLEEAWRDEPETVELDQPETVVAPDLGSDEANKLLSKQPKPEGGDSFPKGDNYHWKDTEKPDEIPADTEWLGDLEVDAEVDDIEDIKKLAGTQPKPEPTKPDWELHPDWYWRDSEGKLIRDRWGDPVKSGSHPDSQKKQPWEW